MEEKSKTYTAADLARYHAGTMPADEMHALEKAALEDPFLEDALEGYGHSTAVESDIAELQARLIEKRKKKNVFFISSFAQNKWWRIAALFIIIAGSGYFFYRLNLVSKEISLSENKIKGSAEKTDSAVALRAEGNTTKADTVTANNNMAFQNKPASKLTQKERAMLPGSKPGRDKEVAVPQKQMESVAALSSDNKSNDSFYADSTHIRKANKANDTEVAEEYVLKGKVTDENGYAIPFANITDKARNKGTTADTSGRFFLRSKDSSIIAMAAATGYESKTFSLKKDMQPTIAMNKRNAELSEVVVTAIGKQKRSKEPARSAKELNGKVDGVQITTEGPQPLAGRENFAQYLKENASPLYDANNKPLTGEVQLSFRINKRGRPKNIKVVKSSCTDCEKEAIRLLENGPGWTGGTDKTGTVVIKF